MKFHFFPCCNALNCYLFSACIENINIVKLVGIYLSIIYVCIHYIHILFYSRKFTPSGMKQERLKCNMKTELALEIISDLLF